MAKARRITDAQLHIIEEVFSGYRSIEHIADMVERSRHLVVASLDRMWLQGLVEVSGERVSLTEKGIAAMNDAHAREASESESVGQALAQMRRIPMGKGGTRFAVTMRDEDGLNYRIGDADAPLSEGGWTNDVRDAQRFTRSDADRVVADLRSERRYFSLAVVEVK